MTDTAELIARLHTAMELLAAEDGRQAKLHDLLETIREQIRLEVAPEHRPVALFTNIQNAVYAMRGRTPLLNDAAIAETLREAVAALSSLVRERDEARKVLRDHHKWHAESGILGIPDGDGGWIEMDNGAEYCDSRLYERTVEALRDIPPEFVVPPRGGWAMGSNHWENWQLAYRQKRAAEARATAAEAERDELAAEIERLTPLAVAYDYLESPARADMAEAEVARLTAENEKMREAGGGTAVTEDGVVLTIQISGSTLAHAVKYMPKAEIFDEGLQDFFHPEIVDEVAFLKEMAGALRCEEEDGTTLVHRMIDDAAIHLMHVGGDGVLSAQEVRDRARASLSNTSEGGKDE